MKCPYSGAMDSCAVETTPDSTHAGTRRRFTTLERALAGLRQPGVGMEARMIEPAAPGLSSHDIGCRVIAGLAERDPIVYRRCAIVFLGLEDLPAV